MRRISGTAVAMAAASLALLIPLASGRIEPVRSTGDLGFQVDVCRFRMAGGRSYIELYYTLPVADFSYKEEEEKGWGASFRTSFTLQCEGSEAKVTDSWDGHFNVVDPDELKSRQAPLMVDQMELENVSPGDYEITLAISDLGSEESGEAALSLIVPPHEEGLALSDIELAVKIEAEADTSDSRFVKNGLYISPNPEHRFGGRFPILYWYGEIYGLCAGSEDAPDSFRVEYSICDDEGDEVRILPGKTKPVSGKSAVEMGGVNVVALEPGDYHLSLAVFDLASEKRATARVPFSVEAMSEAGFSALSGDEGEAPSGELDVKTEAGRLREIAGEWYTRIDFLADRDELSLYESLSPAGKERFLVQFWKDRDPVPQTTRNELLEEIVRRVAYADEHFSSGFEKGHVSDRGRIYIRFGEPDEVERHPADLRYQSFISWLYFGRGGNQYIFIDRNGYGRYELIYTSDQNESFDPDWEELVDPTVVRKRRR